MQVTGSLLLVTSFTIPLFCYPVRVSLHFMVYGEKPTTDLQRMVESSAPLAVVLAIALFVDNVGLVFSFVGAVTTSMISFVVPSVLFLRSKALVDKSRTELALAWLALGTGVMLSTVGLAATLLST